MKNIIKTMLIIAVVIFGGWKLWNIYYEDYNSKQEETSIKNTTKIESQTIQEEGLPTIYIDLDGAEEEYYQNDLEAMIWEVKQQPSYLLKNCSAIYYQSLSSLNEQGGVAYSENTYMTVHIPLDTEENIVGNTVETSESKKTEKYSIRSSILSHELWHIYDFTHGDGNYPLTLCSNDQFDYLYNNYSVDVSTNNEDIDNYFSDEENGRAEFFAECGDMYVNKFQTLQKDTPEIYDFFEALSKE